MTLSLMAFQHTREVVRLPPGFGEYLRRQLDRLRRREIVSSYSLQNDWTTSDKILPVQELLLEGTPEDAFVRAYLALGDTFPEPAQLFALYTATLTKRKGLVFRYHVEEFETALRKGRIPHMQIAVASLAPKRRETHSLDDPVQQLVEYSHQFSPLFTADLTAKDPLERPLRVVLAASDLPGDRTGEKAAKTAAALQMTHPAHHGSVPAHIWEKAIEPDWRRELLGRRAVSPRQASEFLQTFIACARGIDWKEVDVEYRNVRDSPASIPGEPIGLILEHSDEAEKFGIWLRKRRMLQFYISLKDRVLLRAAMRLLDFFDLRPLYDRTDYVV